MLTYDDIKEFFGGSDRSPFEILINIDVKLGKFGEFDLYDAFRFPCENRWAECDWLVPNDPFSSGWLSNSLNRDAIEAAKKSMYHSFYVFRNLWQILTKTNGFHDIWYNDTFVKRLKVLAYRYSYKNKKKNEYYSHSDSDNFETIMSFVDEIEKRKKQINDNQ